MAEVFRYAQIVRPVASLEIGHVGQETPAVPETTGYMKGLSNRLADALGQSTIRGVLPHDGTMPINLSAKLKPADLPEGHQDMQSRVLEEIDIIMTEHLTDVDPQSVTGERIMHMAPALTKAVLGSPLIDGIQSTHALEAIRWGIECAKDPSLIERTVIRTGFGGSDDRDITMRHATYAIPALEVWSRIDQVREDREQAVSKRKANHLSHHMGIQLDNISQADSYDLDDETMAELRKEAGTFHMPQIEFFSAHHAAIEINSMDPERASANAQRGQRLIASYAERFYPSASDHISFRSDAPLKLRTEDDKLTNEGLVITYLENLLERYDGEDVKRVLESLNTRGTNHSNSELARAELYAALHPFLFGDRLEVPTVGESMPRDTAVASITIGGKAERLFNEIRTLLSDKAQSTDFVSYAADRHAEGEISDRQMAVIDRWVNGLEANRSHYEKKGIGKWARADLPAITIPLLTPVGQTPVYYATRADIPLTPENMRAIVETGGIDEYYEARLEAEQANGTEPPTSKERIQIRHAIEDMTILLNRPNKKGDKKLSDTISDESMIKFFSDFVDAESV